MQVTVNLVFDLGTAAGRQMFTRLGQITETGDGQLSLSFPAPENNGQGPAVAANASMTPRQKAAATARAAKAGNKDTPPAPPNGETVIDEPATSEDVAGPETKDDDDMGLSPPAMSPAEARDEALAVVREIYAAGKVKEVKDLQKEYGVSKFYDVPDDQGHAFYRRVVALAQSVGLRQ